MRQERLGRMSCYPVSGAGLILFLFSVLVLSWYSGTASELIYDELGYAGYAENLFWRHMYL